MKTTNDVIEEVFERYVENTVEIYEKYDSENDTSLSDGLQELLEEAIDLWKIKEVVYDLPQQFKVPTVAYTATETDDDGNETEVEYDRKSNTYAVCQAIDKQVAELECIFVSILLLTNLDRAIGKQLDAIGDILSLTRAEAALLCGGTIYFDVLDDEPYRRYLKYKALINANNCTYDTLMKAIKSILGDSAVIEYSEDPAYPATILLDVTPDKNNEIYVDSIPQIKPSGVAVNYLTSFTATIDVAMSAKVYATESIYCGTHYCGTYPESEE